MKKSFEYKWIIAIICFFMIFICVGFVFNARSLLVAVVSDALEVERTVLSVSDSIRYLTTSIISLFFGKILSALGSKKMILAGSLLLSSGVLLYAFATSIYVHYLGSMLAGIGISFAGTSMVSSVLSKWFKKGKGTVMGFVLAASGLGGALATQIFTPLVFAEGKPLGYKNAYFIAACAVIFVGIIILLFFKENPPVADEDVDNNHHKARSIQWQGIEFSEVLKKPYFYAAVIMIFFTGLALQGMTGSASTHIKDVGFSPSFTASMLSMHLIILTVSKLLIGMIYDKWGLRATMTLCSSCSVAVLFILAILKCSNVGSVLVVIYEIVSCLAVPLETIMLPLYAADLLGEKSFTRGLGVFTAVNTAGYALASPIINSCYDAFGSYKYGYALFCVLMFIVLIGFQFVISAAHKERNLTK